MPKCSTAQEAITQIAQGCNYVDISGDWKSPNEIRGAVAQALAEITKGKSPTYVNLYRNIIGPGAWALARAIAQSHSLLSINLRDNKIRDSGTLALSWGIRASQSLTSIDLNNNEIGDVGAQALAESIAQSQSLTFIDLGQNQMSGEGEALIRSSQQRNPMFCIRSHPHIVLNKIRQILFGAEAKEPTFLSLALVTKEASITNLPVEILQTIREVLGDTELAAITAKGVQALKVKRDGQIQKWQPRIHKASVVLQGASSALDGFKLFQEPTSNNAEGFGISFTYWYSMYSGFDQLSIGMNAALISRAYQQEGFCSALTQSAASMFMMLPTVLTVISPYAGFAATLVLKAHIGYNVISKAQTVYQEYGTDAQQLRSYAAWKDMAEWLSDSTSMGVFSTKAQEYDIKLNAIKIDIESQALQKTLIEKNGDFGAKLYEHIYKPFMESKHKLLDEVTFAKTTKEEAENTLKDKLVSMPGLDRGQGYDVCRLYDSGDSVSYFCSDEANKAVDHVSVSGSSGVTVLEVL